MFFPAYFHSRFEYMKAFEIYTLLDGELNVPPANEILF